MSAIQLTAGQQAALEKFIGFIMDPLQTVFVLSGYSGTGKTTLIEHLLFELPKTMKMAKLLDPKYPNYDVELTATTNKAAEAFSSIVHQPVKTIQSLLGLRVHTDYSKGTTTLVDKDQGFFIENTLLFIDEYSFVDNQLLAWILKKTRKCKIIFIGDPAQVTAVNCSDVPVVTSGFLEAKLTEVARQNAGNPIIDLSAKFRHTVNTGEFFSFQPDGYFIQHVDNETFAQQVEQEFTRPDWKFTDSKVLGWTNKCVIQFNHAIRDWAKGSPDFQVGDYAVCNSYISAGRYGIKTDQMVRITDKKEGVIEHNVVGTSYQVDGSHYFFMPLTLEAKKDRIKEAQVFEEYNVLQDISKTWIDLRAAYACTINKSQGSTFRKVFIDLDDVKRCTNGNLLARLMYVGVSRASEQVILTGDLV